MQKQYFFLTYKLEAIFYLFSKPKATFTNFERWRLYLNNFGADKDEIFV